MELHYVPPNCAEHCVNDFLSIKMNLSHPFHLSKRAPPLRAQHPLGALSPNSIRFQHVQMTRVNTLSPEYTRDSTRHGCQTFFTTRNERGSPPLSTDLPRIRGVPNFGKWGLPRRFLLSPPRTTTSVQDPKLKIKYSE